MLNILAVSGNQIVKFKLNTILPKFILSLILFLYLDEANKKAISNAARVQKWTILPTDVSHCAEIGSKSTKVSKFSVRRN